VNPRSKANAKEWSAIAPHRSFEIVTTVLRSFFAKHLNGETGSVLDNLAKRFPETTVDVRQDR
jgi:hypothetical protein